MALSFWVLMMGNKVASHYAATSIQPRLTKLASHNCPTLPFTISIAELKKWPVYLPKAMSWRARISGICILRENNWCGQMGNALRFSVWHDDKGVVGKSTVSGGTEIADTAEFPTQERSCPCRFALNFCSKFWSIQGQRMKMRAFPTFSDWKLTC